MARVATAEEVRDVARALCRIVTNDCVMDEKPKRSKCTFKNCRMMQIAIQAVTLARQ